MNQTENKCDLTEGVIWKKLLAFFLPIAVGTLFQQLYNTVDAVVVGRFVGIEALAAVGGSTAQVIALFIGFFVALSGSAAVVIAQLFGAGAQERISQATHTAIAFSVTVGLVLTAVGIWITPAALAAMDTPADTMADAVSYLRVYFGGTVFVMLFNMGSGILRAVGDSKRPLYYLIDCCFCNIALDLLFVAGLGMGVAGAALATVLSQLLSTCLVLMRLCRTREAYRVELRRIRFHGPVLRRMLGLGIPAGLQSSMYNLSNLIIQVAVNTLGTSVVAAWTMTSKIDGIYWALSGALGTAVMSFVGQNFGAGKTERIRKSLRVSMALFMTITAVMVVLLMTVGRYCLRFFTDDAQVIAYTWEMMTYFIPYYFIWTFIEVISGALRGVGDAVVPVVITGVGICGFRLVWVATVFARFHTVMGISLCYPVSWAITAIAMSVYYRRGHWLEERTTPSETVPCG